MNKLLLWLNGVFWCWGFLEDGLESVFKFFYLMGGEIGVFIY